MTDTASFRADEMWMAVAKMDCDLQQIDDEAAVNAAEEAAVNADDEAAVNAAYEAWNSAIRLWKNCDAILKLIRNVMERFCAHVKACTDGDQSSRHCHLPIINYLKDLKDLKDRR